MKAGHSPRTIVLLAAVLVVPLLPLLLIGHRLDDHVAAWLDPPPSPALLAAGTASLLTCDVFLPVPSSLLSTFCGAHLGVVLGTVTSWLGMNLGAALGFALGRWWGQASVQRWGGAAEVAQAEQLSHRLGPIALAATRPLPLLSEATVLWLGAAGLSWRRFVVPVVLSNLGIALAYSWLGQWAGGRQSLGLALALSLILPASCSWWVSRWLR